MTGITLPATRSPRAPLMANLPAHNLIDLHGVARRFGRHWPLRHVSLQVAPGEGVALMGRNGAGKTTLLRVISTALRATKGTGTVCGHDLRHDPDLVRGEIAVLSYAPGLYPDLTAWENLAFSLRMYGLAPDDAVIRAALERVGLHKSADERVRFFSSGMTRRVALARLFLRDFALLLLDEPYASFDADGIALLNDFCLEARERGAAVVVATHDPARSRAIADRCVFIRDGLLDEIPWPTDLTRVDLSPDAAEASA